MSRHPISSKLAKKEIQELAEQINQKMPLVPSGGFFVTVTVTEPVYRAVKVFVKAENRKLAAIKAAEYDDIKELYKSSPNAVFSVSGAGMQREGRAEGIVMIINDKLGEK